MPQLSARLAAHGLVALLIALLLAGCGGGDGVRKRVFPPTASVQQLTIQPDGRWELKIRLQNFSNVSMLVDELDGTLTVASVEAGKIVLRPGVSVPPESAEIVDFVLMPSSGAANHVLSATTKRNGGSVPYSFAGQLVSSLPRKRRDDFEFASQLSTVPGLDRVLR